MGMMDLTIIIGHLEGSGGSTTVDRLAQDLRLAGHAVEVVREDLTPFFNARTQTYADFCKLPASDRRAASLAVLDTRIMMERMILAPDLTISTEETPSTKLKIVIIDRPWWDAMYYMLRRSAELPGVEGDMFDVIHKVHINKELVTYPEPGLVLMCGLNPLHPDLLKEDAEDSVRKKMRDSHVYKKGFKEQLLRLKQYVNYWLFFIYMMEESYNNDAIPSASTFLLERPTLVLPEEIMSNLFPNKEVMFKIKNEILEYMKSKNMTEEFSWKTATISSTLVLLKEIVTLLEASSKITTISQKEAAHILDAVIEQVVITSLEERDQNIMMIEAMIEAISIKKKKAQELILLEVANDTSKLDRRFIN
jgi:hypothetical protein